MYIHTHIYNVQYEISCVINNSLTLISKTRTNDNSDIYNVSGINSSYADPSLPASSKNASSLLMKELKKFGMSI